MNFYKRTIFIFIVLLSFAFSKGFGQLTLTTCTTAANVNNLIQNILVQGGVAISNITYSGSIASATNSQFGSFTNASTTYLGLSSGVVLSTGYVPHIAQQADSTGIMSDQVNANAHDSDLCIAAGIPIANLSETYDACILQFDFVPMGDTVSFTYVFGSEEEPCWVCDQYDDVFGFFLSGPGIAGPYSRGAVDIALIPGTNYPVSVNTVNDGHIGSRVTTSLCPGYGLSYSMYYINNLPDPYIVCGGLTRVLTAKHAVTPCKTYHIKLAICDTYNGKYDSDVFLGANSFTVPNSASVQSAYSNSALGNNAIKGCSNGEFVFTLPPPNTSNDTVKYIIGGTAHNGVDYNTIPNSVVIPAGQDTAKVIIQPTTNGSSGTVILGVISTCDTVYDTIKIIPYVPVDLTTSGTATICSGASDAISVTNSNSGGIAPVTYNWSNGLGTNTTYNVTPTVTTTYVVTATDLCNQTATDNVTVTVAPPLTISVTPANPTVCPGTNTTLEASGASTYNWNPSTGLSSVTDSIVTVTPTGTTTYTVTGTNSLGCSGTTSVIVTVANVLNITIAPDTTVCPGTTVQLIASGGTTYIWNTTQTGDTLTVAPTTTTIYSVTGTSGSCSGSNNVTVTISNHLPITVANEAICPGGTATLTAVSAATNYTWNTSQTGSPINVSPATTTTYTVSGTSGGCSGTASATVTVNSNPVITVSPASPAICPGASVSLQAAGASTYSWSPGTGLAPTTGANVVADPTTTSTYTVTGTDANGCISDTSVTVTVAPFTVTATKTDENCGQANGTATATPSEACTQGWLYLWSTTPTEQTTQMANHLTLGTYTVTVSCGVCTASTSISINNLAGPSVNIDSATNTTCGYANGNAYASAIGGNSPYIYSWTGGQSGTGLLNVISGTYDVTVTDADGCTATNSVVLTNTAGPTTTTSSNNDVCNKGDGSATVHASGGLGNYTYIWSNGPITPNDTGLTQGNYSVTVSDGECITTASVTVGETPGPAAGFSENPSILTLLDGPVTFVSNSTGNIVNWQWNFGDGNAGTGSTTQHQYTNLGTYLVTLIVIDNNGCIDTVNDTVEVKDYFTFYIPNAFTPNEDGWNDTWSPKGMNVDPNNYTEYIFDRWGNLTFQTNKWDAINHQAEPWKGTFNNNGPLNSVVMDVYVYRILLKETGGLEHEYIGRVTIVP